MFQVIENFTTRLSSGGLNTNQQEQEEIQAEAVPAATPAKKSGFKAINTRVRNDEEGDLDGAPIGEEADLDGADIDGEDIDGEDMDGEDISKRDGPTNNLDMCIDGAIPGLS